MTKQKGGYRPTSPTRLALRLFASQSINITAHLKITLNLELNRISNNALIFI